MTRLAGCLATFLSFVWIRVAGRATDIGEQIPMRRLGISRFMAVDTSRRQVGASKRKPRFAMLCQSEPGRRETIDVMTGFTLVLEAFFELSRMSILVTIGASAGLRMVVGILPLAGVTLHAQHRSMLPDQRIFCGGVIGNLECRGLEAIHLVAADTVTAVAPSQKLLVVFVVMAVRTAGAFHRHAEIGGFVA